MWPCACATRASVSIDGCPAAESAQKNELTEVFGICQRTVLRERETTVYAELDGMHFAGLSEACRWLLDARRTGATLPIRYTGINAQTQRDLLNEIGRAFGFNIPLPPAAPAGAAATKPRTGWRESLWQWMSAFEGYLW